MERKKTNSLKMHSKNLKCFPAQLLPITILLHFSMSTLNSSQLEGKHVSLRSSQYPSGQGKEKTGGFRHPT